MPSKSDQRISERIRSNCEQKLSQPNSVDIRWHVAVFFSEFVINRDITANSFDDILALRKIPSGSFRDFFEPLDYLNWGGKQLYNELKKEKDNPE